MNYLAYHLNVLLFISLLSSFLTAGHCKRHAADVRSFHATRNKQVEGEHSFLLVLLLSELLASCLELKSQGMSLKTAQLEALKMLELNYS